MVDSNIFDYVHHFKHQLHHIKHHGEIMVYHVLPKRRTCL